MFITKIFTYTAFALAAMLMPLQAVAEDISEAEAEAALQRLDKELAGRQKYIDLRLARIDSLRAVYLTAPRLSDLQLNTVMALGDAFAGFENDSALSYYTRGAMLADEAGKQETADLFHMHHASYLPIKGHFMRAQREMERIDTTGRSNDFKITYLDCKRRMNVYNAAFMFQDPDTYEHLEQIAQSLQNEMGTIIPTSHPLYAITYTENLVHSGKYSPAKTILEHIKGHVPEDDNLHARICFTLSTIAENQHEPNARIKYLADAAVADLKAATLEEAALAELSQLLKERGDNQRAYDYLVASLDHAVESKSSIRMLQASQHMPILLEDQNARLKQNHDLTTIIFYVLLIIAAILIVTSTLLLLNVQRKRRTQRSMQASAQAKDVYITQFMNLCSTFIDQMRGFNQLINRKIQSGQTDELARQAKSGKLVEEQTREFFNVFDEAFLSMYPNFPAQVNVLLQPDKQITLEEGELLNTDLRICAFFRLGMEDSSQIAQMLGYSLNTIYSYRNRIRSRAINPETFKQDLKKIE